MRSCRIALVGLVVLAAAMPVETARAAPVAVSPQQDVSPSIDSVPSFPSFDVMRMELVRVATIDSVSLEPRVSRSDSSAVVMLSVESPALAVEQTATRSTRQRNAFIMVKHSTSSLHARSRLNRQRTLHRLL